MKPRNFSERLEELRYSRWRSKVPEDSLYGNCLPVLLAVMNWNGPERIILEALPQAIDRFDKVDLVNTMANLGFDLKLERGRLRAISTKRGPCLFLPDVKRGQSENPLIIIPEGSTLDNGFEKPRVYDAAADRLIDISEINSKNGNAYIFSPRAEAAGDQAPASWFFSLLSRFRGLFWQLFATSIAINILGLTAPLFVMAVYDQVIGTNSPHALYYFVFGVGVAVIAEFLLRYLRMGSICWLSTRIDHIVGNEVFERLLYLPARYTEQSSTASQLARIGSFDSVRSFFAGPLFIALIELPFVAILLAVIALIAGPLVLVPLLTLLAYLGLVAGMRPKMRRAIRDAAKASSNNQRLVLETVRKMEAIRQAGMHEIWQARLEESASRASEATARSNLATAKLDTMANALSVIAAVAMIGAGVHLIWSGDMTVGALIASMILLWRIVSPVRTACSSLPRHEQVIGSVQQMMRLVKLAPERDPRAIPIFNRKFEGAISFSNVGLRYSKDTDPVFAGLSFDIRPGEMVAITGGNGTGKSTILQLINRIHSPQAGSISLDGVDIRQLDPTEIRWNVAYVPQSPTLFKGTIAENLRYAAPFASDTELERALVDAELWDDINQLPDGLSTLLDRIDADPSGGDLAERISLARAYLSEAPIMLFDELSYEFLASKSGEAFRSFLKKSRGRRTVVFITHRSDYLELADKVIVLNHEIRPVVGNPKDLSHQIAA